MLKIENNTIIFTTGYSLDHVITGSRYYNIENLESNAFSNLEFELSLVGFENIDNLENYKFIIPENGVVSLKLEFNSFKELIEYLFEYRENGYIFPYLSKDLADQIEQK